MPRLSRFCRPAVRFLSPISLQVGLASTVLALVAGPVQAQSVRPQLPSAAEPGRPLPQPVLPESTPGAPQVTVQQGSASEAPAGADKLSFTLTDMRVDGVTHYPPAKVSAFYQDLVGKTITVADAFKVANDIELLYRNDGYVTTRVIVPEQTVEGGVFRIVVVEGYVFDVMYDGDIGPAQAAVEKLVARLRGVRPINVAEVERQLLLANDLNGLIVRASLEASPKEVGGSVLVVRSERKPVDAAVGFDNRGSPYLGWSEMTGQVTLNSFGARADTFTLSGRLGFPSYRSQAVAGNYDMLVTDSGMTFGLAASYAKSEPGRDLAPLNVASDVQAYAATVTYPLIRSRLENLRAFGTFDVRNVTTDITEAPFTRDRLRVLRAGLSYDRTDSWNGITAIRGTVHQGLDAMGATQQGAELASRANGRSDFLKFTAELTRLQQFTERLSMVATFAGQYSTSPLLASEEFALGGPNFGRAYDDGEMSADNGVAGSLELRYAVSTDRFLPHGAHVYSFIDGGRIWSRSESAPLTRSNVSSIGAGMRANLSKTVYATFEVAKPTSGDVLTQGNKNPRVFFSISAQY
ncbi:ShlB/FhaC/HecB family hemolysin secretion/activation protein [Achromobacter sp. NFACC18-2]|uniref:ShlB/FhaC/HecB family hemolysin secretion/activation protein n=1 Tax=Achromobacter sp. NFACC18-2 TaxID=1564112 RepID=UPI0008ACEAB7|nr:ShlB/FhaC/HecB family hemolysin secretion/activation protein [Achromobacter sp. NFACC18-2]SEJ84466.1 Hemolysin activation/secretion protein [Achromobacter sp. NFACC18-2]